MMLRVLIVALGALAGYLLFGAAGALGIGAVLVNLFTPLPAAALGMRFGPIWGAATAGLTALAVLATSGGTPTLLFLVQFGFPAVVLPWLLLRGIPWDRAVVGTLGLILALGLAALFWYSATSGQSVFTLVDSLVDKEIRQAVTLMEEFSADAEQSPADAEAFRQAVASMGEFMRRVYPGMLVAVGGALQLMTLGLLVMVARPKVLPGPAFARWRAPEKLIWVLIVAGFAVVFSQGPVQTLTMNLLIVLLPIYFLQGIAVVEHFLGRKVLSPLLRGVGYVLLLVVNPLPVIVTGVGIFDLWADFRRPRQSKE